MTEMKTQALDMRLLATSFRVTYADMPLLIKALAVVHEAYVAAAVEAKLIAEDEAEVATAFSQAIKDGCYHEFFKVGVYAGIKATLLACFDNAFEHYAKKHLCADKADHLCQTMTACAGVNARVRTACHLAYRESLEKVIASCEHFYSVLSAKACKFQDVVKPARVGLQDHLPITLADEFRGYACALLRLTSWLKEDRDRFNVAAFGLNDVGLPDGNDALANLALSHLSRLTSQAMLLPSEPFDVFVAGDTELIAHAKIQALSNLMWRIARDLRILCSGPRGGIQEITLPAVAPGSSIMPGKLNPVIAEMVFSTVDQVDANHAALVLAQKTGWLEGGSAAVMPIKCFMDSADLLSRTMDSFANLCIKGIEANVDHCADLAEQSLLCAKYIEQQCGKDAAGKVFDTALAKGCSVKQAALLLKDQLPGLDFEIFGHLFKGL